MPIRINGYEKKESNIFYGKKGNHHYHQIICWERERTGDTLRDLLKIKRQHPLIQTNDLKECIPMSTESFNWIESPWIESTAISGYNSWIQSIFLRCRCLCDLFAVTSAHTCRGIRSDCCRVCAPLNSLHLIFHFVWSFSRAIYFGRLNIFVILYSFAIRCSLYQLIL